VLFDMKQGSTYSAIFEKFGAANPKVHIPLSREIEATIYNSFNNYCQERRSLEPDSLTGADRLVQDSVVPARHRRGCPGRIKRSG
jgi:hypothetical protein